MDEGAFEFELVHLVDGSDADLAAGDVVAGVFGGGEEGLEFRAEVLDVGEGGVEVDEDGDFLAVEAGAGDVFDAFHVEAVVAHLEVFAVVDALEDGVEDRDTLDDEGSADGGLRVIDFDTVSNIVCVFEEEEDDTVDEFVDGSAETPC